MTSPAGVAWIALALAVIASSALTLAVLWDRSPLLSLALVGPLVAVVLYERALRHAHAATQLALTDPLTGLGNRWYFHERLQRELDAAAEAASPLAVCLLDADDLKRINDAHGHPAGDALLEQVAAALRHGGEAFRIGGDEFALLLPGHDERAARHVADAIGDRLGAGGLRVSCGVAVFPTGADRHEVYRAADEALYASKRRRSNEVVVYASPPPEMRNISGGR